MKWFKDYLSNRKQYLSSQDISESCLDIVCGVPQGSMVGPLSFLILIMEVMFADDTNLFISQKNIHFLLL